MGVYMHIIGVHMHIIGVPTKFVSDVPKCVHVEGQLYLWHSGTHLIFWEHRALLLNSSYIWSGEPSFIHGNVMFLE